MPIDSLRDAAFCDVLNRELVCALGCTEPIAVAYAAALASQTLGCEPDHMDVACSGNIIKNVKSVTVPNSGPVVSLGSFCSTIELHPHSIEQDCTRNFTNYFRLRKVLFTCFLSYGAHRLCARIKQTNFNIRSHVLYCFGLFLSYGKH